MHDAQHILKQDPEEKDGGDGPEQQAHEIRVAFLVAEANAVNGDKTGRRQENPVQKLFLFTGKIKHDGKLARLASPDNAHIRQS